jgi:membrane protein
MGHQFIGKLKNAYKDAHDFVTEKWVVTHDEEQASKMQRFAHFWLLVFKSFSRNKGPLRATALAYTTLLGLVPLLAVGFGIASSFLREKGDEATKELIGQFVDAAAPQLRLLSADTNKLFGTEGEAPAATQTNLPPEKSASNSVANASEPGAGGRQQKIAPRDEVVKYLNQFIQNAQSKTLGVTGVLGFIVVAIMLLSTIEDAFNDIWGVTRGRSWFRRFVQYWATISLGPLVLAVIVALVGGTVFQSGRQTVETFPLLSRLVLPFALVSASFALFYKLMPNTQVHWRSATVAGIVGGTLWLLMNIFTSFQLSRVVSMSAIYGSVFALIPIFLLGLYFSWLILLFGGQVAYALQNRKMYLQERKAESVNQRGREYVALRVMTYMAQRFDHGARSPTILELGTVLGVPSRLIGRVLQPLLKSGLVVEVAGGDEPAYIPARPLETITIHDILMSMRVIGGQELPTRDEPTRPQVCAEFEKVCEAERQAGSAITLCDLVRKIPYLPEHHDPEQVENMWKEQKISS